MFDLEKAIQQWRKTLNKNSSLEDGYKEELECHLRDKIEYLIDFGSSEQLAFEDAAQKIGETHSLGSEFYKSYSKKKSSRPPWEKSRWVPALVSSYLIIALRKIRRQRVFAFINIAGLAVGLACCTIIILYVTNELSYDRYHRDADRIFRVASHTINSLGEGWSASTPGPLGPELKANYPDVEEAVRIIPPFENASHVLVVKEERRFFEHRVWFADKEIFQFFDIPVLQGSPEKALLNPNSVVITEGIAEKYFGEEEPLGQTLQIEVDYDTGSVESQTYEVTGVVKNSPANTHLKYDIFLSISTLSSNLPSFESDWLNYHSKFTYIKLVSGTNTADFETKIQQTAKKASQIYAEEFNRTLKLKEYFIQPVTRIHMFSNLSMEIDPPGNWYYVSIYSIIAFLILLIGCMNFVNLSAALSTTRTKEVGLRKVVGAQRKQLVWQFLGESFLITILAFIFAFGLIMALLIPFNQMAGTELTLHGLKQPIVLASLFGLLLCVGVGSGYYPALILTALNPISVLQGKLAPSSRGSRMQKVLVIGQFAISIFLVICTLTVFQQLSFMKGRALGFNLEQKIILRVKSNLSHLHRDYESIKNDFLQNPMITGATVSSSVPGDRIDGGYYMSSKGPDFADSARLKVITMDYDFIPEYEIKMAAGRSFQRGKEDDENGAYLINIAGVKEMGFSSPEEALGKSYMSHYHRLTKKIVGVTEDFHFNGMQETVEPLVLDIESSLMNTISLSFRVENMKMLMSFIEKTWEAHFPGVPFEYSFLDDNFARVYLYEEQMGRLLGMITSLGFIIACLGLFGLVSFVARSRKKEIGIRKVLGASTVDIVSLLSKDFVKLILISILIASPLAWTVIQLWLQGFAYRIDMNLFIIFAVALGALTLAMTTVSIQGIHAAVTNPANALHDE
ncbi:MAG: ABC transporter permease [Candidatus Aminicenantes bacterium]|nr:ABC transporter permease [Candidatus Aminicenantes bacterium]